MKSHTILGSRSQRGLTQLSLDLIYKSLNGQTLDPSSCESLVPSLSAADPAEGQILSASNFIDVVYGDSVQDRNNSRAPTPMTVGKHCSHSREPDLFRRSICCFIQTFDRALGHQSKRHGVDVMDTSVLFLDTIKSLSLLRFSFLAL